MDGIFKNADWLGVPDSLYDANSIDKDRKENRIMYCRRELTLAEGATLTLSISANSRYRLWVNGNHITAGPCKGDRWRHYYETVDVSSFLRKGLNIIAVKVLAYKGAEEIKGTDFPPPWILSAPTGLRLIVSGICEDSSMNGLEEDISTGKPGWKVCLDTAIKMESEKITDCIGAILERVDGRKLPHGWKDEEMPSGIWAEGVALVSGEGFPWSIPYGVIPELPLKERPIPLLYEKKMSFVREMPLAENTLEGFSFFKMKSAGISGVHIPQFSKRAVELDAGELNTGYFCLKLEGGAGSRIVIRYAESYSKKTDDSFVKGKRDDSLNNSLFGYEDVYISSGQQDTYETFWFRTFRFVRIEVETGENGITIFEPWFFETGYPLEEISQVESSVEWIKPLWDISIRTLKRCMHETYEDCPYYEQFQYTMDTRLEILFTYMVNGDTRLALKALEDYHSSLLPEGILQSRYPCSEPQVIPAFALYWIFMLEDYYWQTGDKSVPRRYRPTVDAVLDWFDRKTEHTGLVSMVGYWQFIDWVEEWDDIQGIPRAILYGPSTILNLIYSSALQCAARLSKATGREAIAQEYEERSKYILQQIESVCWSCEEGLYREGPEFEEYSQHAQVWAVLSGLVSGEKAGELMNRALVKKDILKCSYAMSFYLFRALEKAGVYQRSLALWDKWKELLKQNITTWPEAPFKPRSDCHGWSSLPLYEFTACLLGVKSGEPGWRKILIEPQCLLLQDMKGQVATPHGAVHVEWTQKSGKPELFIEVPEGVPYEIKVSEGVSYEVKVYVSKY